MGASHNLWVGSGAGSRAHTRTCADMCRYTEAVVLDPGSIHFLHLSYRFRVLLGLYQARRERRTETLFYAVSAILLDAQ